jgi:uncharacterized membrane protein YfcA
VFDIPLSELLTLIAVMAGGGALTGLLAGLFGIGGGAVTVPVLYEAFRAIGVDESVRMQLCVGTSLAIIVPTSIRSALAHRQRGALRLDAVKRWTVPILVGVATGGLLASVASPATFKLLFVLFSVLIATKFLLGEKGWRLGDELPGAAAMSGYGLVIGFYSSVMGVGGGSVSTLILTLYGTSIHTAIGTAAAVGVVISIAGTLGFMVAGWPHQALMPALSIGYVSLVGMALMAPLSVLTAPWGARIAHSLSKRQLEVALGVFLLVVAARFVVSLL